MFEDIIIYLFVAVFMYAMGMVLWATMVAEFGLVGTIAFFAVAIGYALLSPND